MLQSSQYSCTFSYVECTSLLSCYTFCGLATYTTTTSLLLFLSTSIFGYFHLQCPTPQHLKHFTFSFTLSCHLISTSLLIPHCITQLTNTSNLFLGISFLSSSSTLFLQLWARCLSFLQLKHFLPSFSSSSALSLARVYYWLSILLIKELYCLRDIVLCLLMSNKI